MTQKYDELQPSSRDFYKNEHTLDARLELHGSDRRGEVNMPGEQCQPERGARDK
jgi:hypothetical protein